jgi:hypothetical protein
MLGMLTLFQLRVCRAHQINCGLSFWFRYLGKRRAGCVANPPRLEELMSSAGLRVNKTHAPAQVSAFLRRRIAARRSVWCVGLTTKS